MADINSFASRWAPYLLSVLRIVAGFLILQHGMQKVLGFPPPAQAPPPGPMPWYVPVSGWLELVGGILLLIGLFTRATAFIMSGLLAVAYFMAHAPQGFWPILNRGELAALYSFVFLYLAAAGGGPWSVDHCLWGRRRAGDGYASRTD
jgi:putative oxidoreductase